MHATAITCLLRPARFVLDLSACVVQGTASVPCRMAGRKAARVDPPGTGFQCKWKYMDVWLLVTMGKQNDIEVHRLTVCRRYWTPHAEGH